MRTNLNPLICAALAASALIGLPARVLAQAGGPPPQTPPAAVPADSARTTALGVFTAEQAAKGHEVYLLACVSCHSPADHTGGGFWKDLVGRTVAEFFSYLRNTMPQDNAGSISNDDYVNVTSYILKLNGLPSGTTPLPADSASQARIRIVPRDTTPPPPGPRSTTLHGRRK